MYSCVFFVEACFLSGLLAICISVLLHLGRVHADATRNETLVVIFIMKYGSVEHEELLVSFLLTDVSFLRLRVVGLHPGQKRVHLDATHLRHVFLNSFLTRSVSRVRMLFGNEIHAHRALTSSRGLPKQGSEKRRSPGAPTSGPCSFSALPTGRGGPVFACQTRQRWPTHLMSLLGQWSPI